MKPSTNMILTQLIERYPCLADIKDEIAAAYPYERPLPDP